MDQSAAPCDRSLRNRIVVSEYRNVTKTLVREKDLLKGLVVIASTPQLFDRLDVFCLHNG